MSPTDRTVTPRTWCDLLDGRDLAPLPAADPCPVDVAMFRFPGLPERLALPPLDAHYISFTLAGALDDRARPRARTSSAPASGPGCR